MNCKKQEGANRACIKKKNCLKYIFDRLLGIITDGISRLNCVSIFVSYLVQWACLVNNNARDAQRFLSKYFFQGG